MKKLLSLLAVIAMVFAMTLSVNAATVSVDGELDGHTFGYYQILSGTQVAGDPSIGTPTWGSGINSTEFLDEIVSNVDGFAGVTDAATFASKLSESADHSAIAEQVAKIAYKHVVGDATVISEETTTVNPGYYLIVDTTADLELEDAKNAALLQITEKDDIVIGNKVSKPTIDKTVNGKKSDDVYIGEEVEMKLEATIPSMKYYAAYPIIIEDIPAEGFVGMSLDLEREIKILGKDADGNQVEVNDFEYNWDLMENNSFRIIIQDLKGIAAINGIDVSKEIYIIVTYQTYLTSQADIGNDGNVNKVKLIYSSNPESDPESDDIEMNETVEKEVYVFTYQLEGTKVDGTDNTKKLSGATFVLKNSVGKYYKVTNGIVSWVDSEDDATVKTSNNNGIFTFTGIDQGTYTLVELTPPAGYNKAPDQTVVITAELSDTAITSLTNGTLADGKVSINVLNYKGATLPETGGMGTTMLYIVGAALVVGAGVVLVSKKRMEEK